MMHSIDSNSLKKNKDKTIQQQQQQQHNGLQKNLKKRRKIKKKTTTAATSSNNKTKKQQQNNYDIDENFKILVHKEIDTFIESFDECIVFPTKLTNKQRAYIHNYIKPYGLLSKSYGKNENRYLTVYKRIDKTNKTTPWLCLTPESRKLMKKYFLNDDYTLNFDSLAIHLNEPIKNYNNYNKLINSNDFRMNNLLRFNINFKIPPRNNCPRNLIHEKRNLPIFQYRNEILQMIAKNQVIIINADTGSGKTTQVPQYILEEAYEYRKPCRIICTQPRRVAAVSIAKRVAFERGEKLGSTVGFQIRLEKCFSPTTNLIYATSGCLLRSLMTNVTNTFSGISHIIIDETHERDKNTDFILISLRDQLQKNNKLKIILMSATMDIELLSNYFGCCKVITIPGRCYETKIYYLEEILYCTEYKTQKMKELLEQKLNGITATSSSTSSLSSSPLSSLSKNHINSATKNHHNIDIDNETQEYLDKIIDLCCSNLLDNDENFAQLLYLIESENIPIDIKHSRSLKTPLIVAAQMNNYEYVEQFLRLNANIFVCDCHGMTALKYSKIYPDRKCYTILRNFQIIQEQQQQQQQENNKLNNCNNLEIHHLLDAYQKQFNDDDDIDHNLLTTLIKMIHNTPNYGSILIFLPGYDDIILQKDQLIKELPYNTYKIFLLHSNMKIEDQQRVLEIYHNVRKIILSTNIGETSITFPDVIFVIDCGKIKMKTYDSITGTSYLKSTWISKACAQQRCGRAGRTNTGICYRMYSRKRYDIMDKFAIPEFLRIPLTEICLYAKTVNPNVTITTYLYNALNPPSNISICNAVNKLKIIGALDNNENITILGQHLVDIPIEVQLGKCLLYSIWMKCLNPILTIAAFHSVKDPFILPFDRNERGKASSRRKLFCGNSFSDHVGIINLYEQWKYSKRNRNEYSFCSENYLTCLSLNMIDACRQQIYDVIKRKYYLNDYDLQKINENSNNWQIIYSCLICGLYPNICYIERDRMKITSRLEKSISIHPSSALKPSGYRELKQYIDRLEYNWIVFFEKTTVNRYANIRYNTLIPPIIIALFCGQILINTKKADNNNKINDKLEIGASNKQKNDYEENDDDDDNDDDNDEDNDEDEDIDDDDDDDDEDIDNEEEDNNCDDDNEDDDGDDDNEDDEINDNEENPLNNEKVMDYSAQKLIIDDWIEFFVCPDDKDTIEKLRKNINKSFIKFLNLIQINYQNDIKKNNSYFINNNNELLNIIKELYKCEINIQCSMDELSNSSYIKNNGKNEVMTNIGYFKP